MIRLAEKAFSMGLLKSKAFFFAVVAVSIASVFIGSTGVSAQTQNSGVRQVSTGQDSACAVVNFWVKCWGSNENGKLGIGKDVGAVKSTPVSVANNKNPIAADPGICSAKNWFGQCTQYLREPTPAQPASALAGKDVEKVSVSTTHACALAYARVYCWGDNSKGQLGNRTNTSSTVPVGVDIQSKDVTPAPVTPKSCGGWFQPKCTPVAQPTKPKSALGSKEVIDVTAGNGFTCALATDGTVACWGLNDSGQLGTDNRTNANYPVSVSYATATRNGDICVTKNWLGRCTAYNQIPASALAGKKVNKLASLKGIAATMCVVTREDKAVCWGENYAGQVGNGGSVAPPASGTGSATNDKQHCSQGGDIEADARQQAVGQLPAISDQSISRPAAVATSQLFDNLIVVAGDDTSDDGNGTAYSYVTGKTTASSSSANRAYWWGGSMTTKITSSCSGDGRGGLGHENNQMHNTAKATASRTYVGKTTPFGPVYAIGSTPLTGQPLIAVSGNAYDGNLYPGLFCTTRTDTVAYCDTHGSSSDEGQTGSGYTKVCRTTSFFGFPVRTCDPVPTGPQKVSMDGLFAGKTITNFDTGSTGYTCAIASGTLGCWGVNTIGQLGTGDTANKYVPTAVKL